MKTLLTANGVVCRAARAISSGCLFAALWGSVAAGWAAATLTETNRPIESHRLFFIHHSTGENWLHDEYGGLGLALRGQGYFVSDSNYGWGPEGIGDRTDVGNWHEWFRGPDAPAILAAVAGAGDQNCAYSRLEPAPAGLNRIILFKSCFPNSALQGDPRDPVPPIAGNPLRGQDAYSGHHTVANAKGIYRDLLGCFAAQTNTLFVTITAPPLSDPAWSANARAFNTWLVGEWLDDYPHANVFVFDFYNVLTSNNGSPEASDVGLPAGNHHRWWNGTVQHQTSDGGDTLAYGSDDDHPNEVGSRKATAEFVPLLNAAVNAWRASIEERPQAPGFASLHLTADGIELAITNLSAKVTYALQRNPGLAAGSWVDLALLSGSNATNWTDTGPLPAGHGFYRVQSR